MLIWWLQVFVALVQLLEDFGRLACLQSPAVQALRLAKLGFVLAAGVGRGWRRAAGKAEKADAAAVLQGIVYALSR